MADSFVPLVPVVPSHAKPFATFNGHANGKAISNAAPKPADAVNGASAATMAASPATSACAAKPKITLQRNGDIVSSIRIQCGCGEVIELTCLY